MSSTRSKRFSGLDMAQNNAEKAKEATKAPLPLELMKEKADEAVGTCVLHWENLQLSRLPKVTELAIPPMVTTLKVFNNALLEFPPEVLKVGRLEALELNANLLTSIPRDINMLKLSLRSLHVHHNHLQELIPEIGELTNLTSLRVHGNRLKELPLQISLCTNLMELTCQDNPFHKPFVDCNEVPLKELLMALDHLRVCHERKELQLVPMCVSWLKATAVAQAHRLSSVLTCLYLPHNDVGELPDLMGDFSKLQVLSLFNCNISTTSPRLSEMRQCLHIDLRRNKISTMPPVMGLPLLKTFLLDENAFEEFPVCILTCRGLEYLSLRNNNVETVPVEIGQLTNLTVLSLANNKLVDMPVEVGHLVKLKVMEIVGNQMSNVPLELLGEAGPMEVIVDYVLPDACQESRTDGPLLMHETLGATAEKVRSVDMWEKETQVVVDYFQRLDYGQTHLKMDMSGLGLQAVQIAMLGLTHLTELNLSNNLIPQLPLGMAFMPLLKLVDLSGNECIEWLPKRVIDSEKHIIIEMMSRLRDGNNNEHLDLSGLKLLLIPSCVFDIESLITLDLRKNDIYKLPDEFGFVRTLATLTDLKFDHNKLRAIPDSFGELTSLTSFTLSHNDVRFLAPELSECTLLQHLTLDNNASLESPPIHVVKAGLSAVMEYLSELNKGRSNKVFDLSGRHFLRVPVDLSKYSHLLQLNLSHNNLMTLPNNICSHMLLLQSLSCTHNRLTGLPDGIGLLVCLIELFANDNKITQVPVSFIRLLALQNCSLANNSLTWIPNGIGHMGNIRNINLLGNNLRSPPPDIVAQGTMRILRFLRGLSQSEQTHALNLSALGMTALPLMICRQTALVEIKLFQNKIEEVPAKAGRLTNLKHLVLSANKISELPLVLTRWQQMERFYVDDNLLTEIPECIGVLTRLTEIRMAGNGLKTLPEGIGKLCNLMLFDASRNQLESLPVGLTKMTQCRKLRLGNNKLIKLVDGLDNLKLLEEISVGHNPLLCLPPEICLLRCVRLLLMDNCHQLASPPTEIREQGLLEVMKFLERVRSAKTTNVLDLAWLGVKEMYLDPHSLTSLTTLNLSGNNFENLPEQIPYLLGLRTLTFDENRLKLLPPGLGCLTNITKLSFKGNPVESPPEEIIDRGTDAILIFLRRLWVADQTRELDLSEQGIEAIHVSVCNLTSLTILCLDNNRCSTLPLEVFQLTNLTSLSLKRNKLVKLPPTLGKLHNVNTLLLDGNPTLKAIPPECCMLTKLAKLGFQDNALRSPGMEICAKGVKAVLEYLDCVLKAVTSKQLIVTSLGMQEFAVDLAARPTVMTINVSNNYLDDLHPGFFILLNISHLDISFNRIKKIPVHIGNLRELVWFCADGNVLTVLPTSLAYIDGLKYLSANENAIVQIPEDFRDNTSLTTLDLSSNKISHLRGDMCKLSCLTSLNLARNNIRLLPPEWGVLTNLEDLNLAENDIEDPPLEVRRIGVKHMFRYLRQVHQSLTTNKLELQDLNLENVEGVLKRNMNLVEVYFDRNKIAWLSPIVGQLHRLQVLSLENNDLQYLPSELGQCTTLKELRVDKEKLISPPQDILSEDIQYILRYLRNFASAKLSGELDLTSSLHREIPPEILSMTSLTWLSLKKNILFILPATVTALQNLTHLDLAGNKFKSVPPEIGCMTSLQYLALEDNMIEELPRELRFLTNLTELTIANPAMWSPPSELHMQGPKQIIRFFNSMVDGILTNRLICEGFKLEEIPLEILKETQLNFLSLADNHIRSMPIAFGDMMGLEEFWINKNKLTMVTPVIWQLTQMTKLSFAGNDIRYLPPEMGLMDAQILNLLELHDCPYLESPPPEVVKRGVKHMLPYLEALFNSRMTFHIGLKRWHLENFSFSQLDNLKEVKSIDLSWNNFKVIPDDMCREFPALNSLQLDRNSLQRLMPSIGELVALKTLHATWNILLEIPDSICNLSLLRDLRLHHNEIVHIPKAIGELFHLMNLDLNTNLIIEIPTSITKLCNLENIDLHDNKISKIPDNCSRLTSLIHLNVCENLIPIIQDEIGRCPNLETIECAHNPLTAPPEEVSIVGGAKVAEYIRGLGRACISNQLSLPSMNLSHIPKPVLELLNLESLEMVDNQIPVLPLELFLLTNLTHLNLRINRLGDLQPEIHLLWKLNTLILDRNDLMDLPYDIHLLTDLTNLSLADNTVSIMPVSIAYMTQLKILNTFGNQCHFPPREVMKVGLHAVQEYLARRLAVTSELPKDYEVGEMSVENTQGKMVLNDMEIMDLDKTLAKMGEVLVELYCNNNLLQDLPHDLTLLTDLTTLELEDNQFKEIPMDICELVTLKRLSFSNNLLMSLPARIGELGELEYMILNNNKIGTIPPDIRGLMNLKVLNMDNNILETIPSELGNIYGLKELHLANNRISSLPASLMSIRSLEIMDLASNNIVSLPADWVAQMQKLQYLDISRNKMIELPAMVVTSYALTYLDFRDNHITEVPLEVDNLSSLKELHLTGNSLSNPPAEILRLGFAHTMKYIKSLNKGFKSKKMELDGLTLEQVPACVVSMTQLTSLSFKENLLNSMRYQGVDELAIMDEDALENLKVIGAPVQAIGMTISPLVNLKELDLSKNLLTIIPVDILLLTNLVRLDLSKNRFTMLYLEFAFMPKLKELVVLENDWRSPHASILEEPFDGLMQYLKEVHQCHFSGSMVMNGRRMKAVTTDITLATALTALNLDNNSIDVLTPEFADLFYLQSLSLRKNRIVTLPWEFGGLASLSHMDLGHNKIEDMPGVVGTLSSLKVLLLDHNGLSKLPNAIGELVKLERLSIECNDLMTIPPTAVNLTSLTFLDCSHNNLRLLPLHIGQLESLQELYATNNQLYSLPNSIGSCSSLHTLALSNNYITAIPVSIQYLSSLTHLSLKNNNVKVLPPVMSQNELLINFDFDQNPILDPPQLVLDKGFTAVMIYLKKMFDVAFTGHLDLRDLQLPDLPADLLGAMGGPGETPSQSRPATAKSGGGMPAVKLGVPIRMLSLTGNRLEYLPPFVGELSALRDIRIDDTIKEPPPHIINEGLPIIQLYLRKLGSSRHTSFLDLHGMMLDNIELKFYKLHDLINGVNLSQNNLTEIPAELFRYHSLTWLDMRNNLLSNLPEDLTMLKELRHCDLRNNRITVAPHHLFARENLLYVSLQNNPLQLIGAGGPAAEARKYLAEIQGASLLAEEDPDAEMPEMPTEEEFEELENATRQEECLELESLQHLLLKDADLDNIPEMNGTALTQLDLGRNRLMDGTIEQLIRLSELRILRMPGNRLQVIPEEIDELKSLVHLDLSHNRIFEIPNAISELTELCLLSLRYNKIPALPTSLFKLTKIQQLQVSGNQIVAIPTQVGQLLGLRELLVDNNQIMSLPLELGKLTRLEELNVNGNPGNLLPEGFAEKGMKAVMEFFAWNCYYSI